MWRENINARRVFVGKSEGTRHHGRCRRRWEDNIKMDIKEIERQGVGWVHLAQDNVTCWTVVNTVLNFSCSIKWRVFLE
jgi:hypothetical protein